jgi:hypothetical protein
LPAGFPPGNSALRRRQGFPLLALFHAVEHVAETEDDLAQPLDELKFGKRLRKFVVGVVPSDYGHIVSPLTVAR